MRVAISTGALPNFVNGEISFHFQHADQETVFGAKSFEQNIHQFSSCPSGDRGPLVRMVGGGCLGELRPDLRQVRQHAPFRPGVLWARMAFKQWLTAIRRPTLERHLASKLIQFLKQFDKISSVRDLPLRGPARRLAGTNNQRPSDTDIHQGARHPGPVPGASRAASSTSRSKSLLMMTRGGRRWQSNFAGPGKGKTDMREVRTRLSSFGSKELLRS